MKTLLEVKRVCLCLKQSAPQNLSELVSMSTPMSRIYSLAPWRIWLDIISEWDTTITVRDTRWLLFLFLRHCRYNAQKIAALFTRADPGDECFCRDWHGCIMSQSIIGLENVQPYKFSECSRSDYIDALRIGQGLCLLNKPNEVS